MPETMTWREWRENDDGGDEVYDAAGCPNDDTPVQVFIDDGDDTTPSVDKVFPHNREVPNEGWSVFAYMDDFQLAVFKDGKPVMGEYCSTRGRHYQAGVYIHDGRRGLFATNLNTDSKDSGWIAGDTIDVEIARDFLLGKPKKRRKNSPTNPT